MCALPKVSIIVPIYNIEKYLRQCIDSIIAQTFTDFEVLLIDDGSTDSCSVICDEYVAKDKRVKAFHKNNGGSSSARNHGIERACGEWIMLLDGDDWIEPDMLELLLTKASDNNADIVFGNFFFDFPSHSEICKTYCWIKQELEGLSEYIVTPWTTLWGGIYKHELIKKYKLRSPEGIVYCEDFHLAVRLCFYAKSIAKVNKPLYHYRQQEGSIMHNLTQKNAQDELWAYEDTITFFKENGVYSEMKEAMAFRSLKNAQDLALNPATFDKFRSINPDKTKFIFSCPFINTKLKIIMWCLTHHLRGLAALIVKSRRWLGR